MLQLLHGINTPQYFRDVITHGSKVVKQWCLLERILIEYSRVPPKDVQGNDQ
jgi:hypothetical protein